MEIKDIGYVLSLHRFSESKAVVKILSKENGVCSGIIRNITNKQNNIFFPGNYIYFKWSARLSEHAGIINGELVRAYSSVLMQKYINVLSLSSIFGLIELLFREHEAVEQVYEYLNNYITIVTEKEFNIRDYINFEIFLLAQAGYSLDFSKCVVSGVVTDLTYISPKSGKAVSAEEGRDYADKLLPLPKFLTIASDEDQEIDKIQIKQAFTLLTYFFERYIFIHISNKKQIKLRENLINYFSKD